MRPSTHIGVGRHQKRASFQTEIWREKETLTPIPSPGGWECVWERGRGEGYSYWMNPGARMPSGSYFFFAATTRGHWSPKCPAHFSAVSKVM